MGKNTNRIARSLAACLALVVGFAAVASAVQVRRTPNDKRGNPISHPLYGGADYYRQSTTTEAMACTGKCLLLGLVRATGTITTEIWLRDTGTADNGTSPEWRFIFQPETGAYDNPIPFPVLFSNGIAVDLSGTGDVKVLYLDLD